MINLRKFLWISTIGLLLSSCVSQKKFDALNANYTECLERAGGKERIIQDLNGEIKSYKNQMALLKDQNNLMKTSLDNCLNNSGKNSANIDKLIGEIGSSNSYIKKLIASNSRKDSLNVALSDKLKKSLDNVKDEDVQVKVLKGVVFISLSDKMLYKTGGSDVLPAAEVVLEKVAKVINDYKDYDVLVEGHTDNVPMRGLGVLKDNWDLSALRATSVVRMLQTKFGVAPNRMTAGGRSEFVPKATNNTDVGRAENRRTEIIILPKLDEFMKLMDVAPSKLKP
jgi:chemotaxis protein MotB